MDCSELVANLFQYVDNELPAERCRLIREHIDECAECLARLGLEQEFRTLVQRKCAEGAPPELVEQIKAALDSEVTH